MIKINWLKDYCREFVCPFCQTIGLQLYGKQSNGTRRFFCSSCGKRTSESCPIKTVINPKNGTIWRKRERIDGFICPNPECNESNICFDKFANDKVKFRCRNCGKITFDSIDITASNLNRYAQKSSYIQSFSFESEQWDLRSLLTTFDEQDNRFIVYFEDFCPQWFKILSKNYVYHLCKLNKSFSTINKQLSSLRIFSTYLSNNSIFNVNLINRELILDFLSKEETGLEGKIDRLVALRNFFSIGNNKGWFKVSSDIIRSSDYPKRKRGNPDPISDIVREQIEKNLNILPQPIARMWIITFFTAMRPNEIALLKKDCLVQEGSNWKVVWSRKKVKDQHEVPVTRVIAKVVQEQVEYIESLWGLDWEYLFCHYQGFSQTDPSQLNLVPVKKVIPQPHNPLNLAIRCLIKALNIRNENGVLAEFSACLIRPTRLTQLFEQGHDLAIVSAWAGHKHLETTSTYYTHVSCNLIEKEVGHIQKALLNIQGQYLKYESMPKTFWENKKAHQLELSGDHINTPIYGYCGLPLDQRCDKFRACYTCSHFAAPYEKLAEYIKTRDELRAKECSAKNQGADVLIEQYRQQADQLDKIIAALQETT